MILDHIVQRAGFLVVGAAAFHADGFGTRNLDVVHIPAIPQRLEDAVAEAERQDVLDGLFAEIVVDAVDFRFVERFVQPAAQFACAFEIVPERFLHYPTPPPLAPPQPVHTGWAASKDRTTRSRRCAGRLRSASASRRYSDRAPRHRYRRRHKIALWRSRSIRRHRKWCLRRIA